MDNASRIFQIPCGRLQTSCLVEPTVRKSEDVFTVIQHKRFRMQTSSVLLNADAASLSTCGIQTYHVIILLQILFNDLPSKQMLPKYFLTNVCTAECVTGASVKGAT